MVVTLDVSKLRDWLNAIAPCRVEERTYKVGSMRAGRREGMRRRRRKQRAGEDPTGDRAQGTRGAHIKHVAHVCGFGRVETQRLVERRRPLPSRKKGMQSGQHAGREPGGRGVAVAQATRRRGPDCGDRRQGTRGAHPKHVAYVCDAGSVKIQRLVERPRVLPSQEEDIRSERHAGWEAGGRGTATAQATWRTQLWRSEAGHARSAHETCGTCL